MKSKAFKAFMAASTILSLFSSASSLAADPAKKQMKTALESLTPAERLEYLSHAEVFNRKYDPEAVKNIDVIADVEESCGLSYRTATQEVTWPQVQCQFHADTEKSMGGGSSKFLCDLPEDTKVKVRYAPKKNPYTGESEVVETILGETLAKLVGFPSKRACPAEVTCINCPNSDPWNNKELFRSSDHSSAPGVPGRKAYFPFAMLEKNIKAFHISSAYKGNAPDGVHWPELKVIAQNIAPAERRRMMIEREVMVLWIHFLMNPDAGPMNNRLSCMEKEAAVNSTSTTKVTCERPLVYVHDYGHSFYEHFQFENYIKNPVLLNAPNGGCYGILGQRNILNIRKNTPIKNADGAFLLDARISSEARDELVARLNRITDRQWQALYDLARISKAQDDAGMSHIGVTDWIMGMKQKIRSMEEAKCLPFDEGSSLLGARSNR